MNLGQEDTCLGPGMSQQVTVFEQFSPKAVKCSTKYQWRLNTKEWSNKNIPEENLNQDLIFLTILL